MHATASGLPFNTEEVSLSNKPRWFLELNPKGQVCARVISLSRSVTHSQSLTHSLAHSVNSPPPPPPCHSPAHTLVSASQVPVLVVHGDPVPESDATLTTIAALHGSHLQDGDGGAEAVQLRQFVNAWHPRAKRAVLGGSAVEVQRALKELEGHVHETGPYLCGLNFCTADASLAPFVQRLDERFGIPADCPRLTRWWGMMREHKSVCQTIQPSWWWWW
jgi:glutathione S-transferase